ncbi:hypothetical protein ACFY2V_17770 [Streptomyces eurythermus]|uniref:hypothetical protein n=1 Tax=Streptomyces eurythermus TaxID=42237 RepID=UPI0036A12426
MVARTGVFGALTQEHRDRLRILAREVSSATDERVFNESVKAGRFRTLGAGDLLGWSWLIPPRHRHLGAQASSPARAYEFDAAAVRELCGNDPELDHALLTVVAGAVAGRLRSSRVRLLDPYAPHGAGEVS